MRLACSGRNLPPDDVASRRQPWFLESGPPCTHIEYRYIGGDR